MLISLIQYVSLFAAFQYTLFSLYLLSLKKGNTISNRIFAIFLITSAIRVILVTFKFGIYAWTTYLIIGPIIYIYTLSLIHGKFKLKWKYMLHFLPYLLY